MTIPRLQNISANKSFEIRVRKHGKYPERTGLNGITVEKEASVSHDWPFPVPPVDKMLTGDPLIMK